MSVLFSRQCEYALQAVLFLAKRPTGSLTSIRELADALDIPYDFLAKILQGLAGKGLLISQKGATGGFGLAHPATDITLLQVVKAIDGAEILDACVLGSPECSRENPCAVHGKWEDLRDDIHSMLETKSIAEMTRENNKPHFLGR